MADQPGTLEQLALAAGRLFRELGNLLADDQVLDTFESLGVRLPDEFLTNAAISNARNTIATVAGQLDDLIQQLADAGDAAAMAGAAQRLIDQAIRVIAAVPELATAITNATGLPGVTPAQLAALAADLPTKLRDMVLADLIQVSPPPAALLTVLGVLERTEQPGDRSDPTKPPYDEVAVHLDRLLPALVDPVGALVDRYGWGTAGFDAAALLKVIGGLLGRSGLPVLFIPGPPPTLQAFALDLTPTADGQGLRFKVVFGGETDVTLPIERSDELWTANLVLKGDLPAGLTGEIRRPLSLDVEGTASGSVTFELTGAPPQPIVLIGQAGGSRLEIAGFDLAVGLELTTGPGGVTAAPTLQAALKGGKLVIDGSSGDGFIATVLSGVHLESTFDIGVAFSPEHGLTFAGNGGLSAQFPVHVSVGPVEIDSAYVALGVKDGKIPLELSAGFSVSLGPNQASVDRLGLLAELSFPDGGGNLGPAQLDFAFKPPNGIGLSVNAGLVAGGGYLAIDTDRGEYSGALALEFAGFIELTAIGLISTRMPDGTGGFSLLIVITAEFGGGGIQLGYGFTLLAVGGIIGLNRGLNLDELVKGVRAGSLDSVMFPKDVIANAPRIISDLRRYFPPERGTFLVGPMAKIGWGTPTLVSVSLGLIIEIPPGTIAILGVLKCVLPTEDLPLLVLQVDFAGAFEPDKKQLWFFAELFDSHILTMTIDGGLGLYVSWGDNPDFVLTVGGFHPSYNPPKLPFPVPDRLSIDILNQPGELIRVSAYFAVTSNTVQFGAAAQLELGFGGFGISGHLSFDALFQFSPFRFVIDISAGVSLQAFSVGVFSIDLRFQLEGPSPWRAHGRGSISLLFFEISADFDISWGADTNTTLPGVAAMGLLAAEIGKTEGWETRLPTGGGKPLVTLRQLDSADLVLHPLGTLFIRQRALPLGVRIDRVGQRRPTDGKRFTVAPDSSSDLVQVSTVGDKFAMAQYQDMDDAAKLARAGFEDQDAGLELTAGAGRLSSARVVRRSARFELIVDDTGPKFPVPAMAMAAVAAEPEPKQRKQLVEVSPAIFTQLLAGSSTARSPLSQQRASRLQPFAADQTVQVSDQRYVVAYVRNNVQAFPPSTSANRQGAASYRSQATAADAMAEWTTADPTLTGKLHVIPSVEMAGTKVVPGTWTQTTNTLLTPVHSAEAVLLNNGKVLVAGGIDGTGHASTAAAVLDPVTNTWATDTKSMGTARRGHTMTVLPDGKVLVAGGTSATDDNPLATTEIYDPIQNVWSTGPNMNAARLGHTATMLKDGSVLVAGGTGPRGQRKAAALSTVEVFTAGSWSKADMLSEPRTGHQAVRLIDGSVLLVGGETTTGGQPAALATTERYDPTTTKWTQPPELSTPRRGHQATLLADGSVLVTGGRPVAPSDVDAPFRSDALEGAELIDKDLLHTWQPIPDLPGGRTGHRVLGLSGGPALVVGGTTGPVAEAGYRTVASYAKTWATLGDLATGRWDAAVVELADGRALVAGGRVLAGNAGDAVTGTAELLTL